MALFFQDKRPAKRYVTSFGAAVLASFLFLLGIIVVQNVMGAWPMDFTAPPNVVIQETVEGGSELTMAQLDSLEARVAQAAAERIRREAAAADTIRYYVVFEVGRTGGASWDFRLLLISIFMGALGSWVHAVSSYVRFVGNRELVSSWLQWYLMRPILGGGMAAIFYVVVRAGFATTAGAQVSDVSHYTVAAFAALVGLFTHRATRKLADVFDALFTPRVGEEDKDRLGEDREGGVPSIQDISPRWIKVENTPQTVDLTGVNFTEDAVVKVNGAEVPSTRRAAGQLRFELDPSFRGTAGTLEVVVGNGSGVSEPKRIVVTP